MTQLDTGTDHLLAEVNDGVATLTMNRPERRNALSTAMLDALARTLAEVEVDDDVGCIVLTGAGGAFCAGGDVRPVDLGLDFLDRYHDCTARVPGQQHRQEDPMNTQEAATWSQKPHRRTTCRHVANP